MIGICNLFRLSILAMALLLSQPVKAQEIALGDSIALGLKDAGHLKGGAVVGASPRAVFHMVTTYPPDLLKGSVVILSCGASNNPAGLSDCEAMLQYLDDHGAKTILMGVGDVLPDSVNINNTLSFFAQAHHGIFIWGWPDVHPRNYNKALAVIREMECKAWRICEL